MLIGDGFCHDFNNNLHCSFDGGDCCGPCVNKDFCIDCKCLTGQTEKITNALVGNGFCNDETNTDACNFDGGDCCGMCVNLKYCNECDCIGEILGIFNQFVGNGYCQDELNHGDCMFDGLDCCGYDLDKDGHYAEQYNHTCVTESLQRANQLIHNMRVFYCIPHFSILHKKDPML